MGSTTAQRLRTTATAGIGVLAVGVGGIGVTTAAYGGSGTHATHHHAAPAAVPFGSGVSSHYAGNKRGILKSSPTFIARTAALKKGTYFVSVATMVDVPDVDNGAFCQLSPGGPNAIKTDDGSGQETSGLFPIAITSVMKVKTGTKISEFCSVAGDSAGEVIHAGLFAIRIAVNKPGTVMKGVPTA